MTYLRTTQRNVPFARSFSGTFVAAEFQAHRWPKHVYQILELRAQFVVVWIDVVAACIPPHPTRLHKLVCFFLGADFMTCLLGAALALFFAPAGLPRLFFIISGISSILF
jgi:hypothetical protein